MFLLLAGLILVTGATLAGVLRVTGAGVLGTGRALRRSTEELAATVARRPATAAAQDAGRRQRGMFADEPLLPPEPDTAELIVRATHVEAPPIQSGPASEPTGEPSRGPAAARAPRARAGPVRPAGAGGRPAGGTPARGRRPRT